MSKLPLRSIMDLKDAQELMAKMYYHRDRRRGIDQTYMWLVEEIGEIARCLIKNEGDIGEEVADALAWLLSLANLLGIDLNTRFGEKYGQGCPRCHRIPCQCPY